MAYNTFLTDEKQASSIAFGSNVPRYMFPIHAPPTRHGIEQGLRGQPHTGPGSYDRDPVELFLDEQDRKPKSRVGWYFGCRTAKAREPLSKTNNNPGPIEYQSIVHADFADSYQPFNVKSPRFSDNQYQTKVPGPGHYDHDVERDRRPEYHYAFGGLRTLKETVKIKCTNGIPEQCNSCNVKHIGDYYENSSGKTLCPKCYSSLKNANTPFRAKTIRDYYKVRDCRAIHKHEFPGFPPKLILQSEKEQRRLKQKEAYMRLYYSE